MLQKKQKHPSTTKHAHNESIVSGNVMEDIEDTLRGHQSKMDLSVYNEVDQIFQKVSGKQKDQKNYENDKNYLSSTNKSMISAFSPDVVPKPFEAKKKSKNEKEMPSKYRKYRPT